MGDLVRMGKIRYFGLSNSSGWQVTEAVLKAQMLGAAVPVCNQIGYSLLRRYQEREVIPACEHFGLSVLPYSALHGGLLSGMKMRDAKSPAISAGAVATDRGIQRRRSMWLSKWTL